jgi:AraC family transcriptional regulator
MEWVKALNDTIEFIELNLTQKISVSDIAQYINFSTSHLHRAFNAFTGFTVYEYIRNRRLSMAGEELAKGNVKVIDIAYKYGYDTPESFSKAFHRFHGITPARAKKEGAGLKSFNPLTVKIQLEGGNILKYKIVKKEEFDVCVLTRKFDEYMSNKAIPEFWDEYFDRELQRAVPADIGICTQERVGSREFKYGIGCVKNRLNEYSSEFEILHIPKYTWAIFTCTGQMPDAVQSMWSKIYREWLPGTSYEIIMDYEIEYYTQGDWRADNYISEIWIPVKGM